MENGTFAPQENIMENGIFAPQEQMYHVYNILENLTFQKRQKALVWSKGWRGRLKTYGYNNVDIPLQITPNHLFYWL